VYLPALGAQHSASSQWPVRDHRVWGRQHLALSNWPQQWLFDSQHGGPWPAECWPLGA